MGRGVVAKRRSMRIWQKRRAENGHLIKNKHSDYQPRTLVSPYIARKVTSLTIFQKKSMFSDYMALQQAPGDPKDCNRFVRRDIGTKKSGYSVPVCQLKIKRFPPNKVFCLYTEEGNSVCPVYQLVYHSAEFRASYESRLAELTKKSTTRKSGLEPERLNELKVLGALSLGKDPQYDNDFTLRESWELDEITAQAMDSIRRMTNKELLLVKRGFSYSQIEQTLNEFKEVIDEVEEELNE